MKFEVGISDDYSCVTAGDLTFYYGYEFPSIIGVPEENGEQVARWSSTRRI